MKKALLIITLFIGLVNLNAQDANNDANWEETIGFIVKNQNHLKDGRYYSITPNFTSFYIEKNFLFCEYKDSEDNTHMSYKIDLSKLIQVKLVKQTNTRYERDDIILKTVGENILVDYNNEKYGSLYRNNIHFFVSNIEMRERLIKAFEHLAYLATNNRETERKASGDKF